MPGQKRKIKKLKPVKLNCPFCQNNTNPSYRDFEMLRKYTTERGKILAKTRTGVCAKHQRKISVAIKHARHVALMPFMVQV